MSEIASYGRLQAYKRLIRPPNSVTAGIAVVTALFLAIEPNQKPLGLGINIAVAAAAFFVTAHAMVHNDIVDLGVDKINASHRPLPMKIVSMPEAKIFAIILFLLACISGWIADTLLGLKYPFSFLWAILNMILLDLYNLKFKKSGLIGNLIVAYVVWALFIYADVIIGDTIDVQVEAIGLFAFFMNWGREVIKGIRDIEGDRDGGVRTIAVRFGEKGGALVGSFLLFIAVLSTIPLIINPRGSIAIPYILGGFDLFIIYRSVNLIRAPTPQYANQTKLWMLYLMLFAMIVLLLDQLIIVFFS